jgi:hypothetical protein
MGKNLKGWALAEKILGKAITDRLRSGKHIDIVATNGYKYRMHLDLEYPENEPVLINMTTMEKYCFQPESMNYGHFPAPDYIIAWYEYIVHKPDAMEKIVGGEHSGHRTKMSSLSFMKNSYIITPEELEEADRLVVEQVRQTTQKMFLMFVPEFLKLHVSGDIKFETIQEE